MLMRVCVWGGGLQRALCERFIQCGLLCCTLGACPVRAALLGHADYAAWSSQWPVIATCRWEQCLLHLAMLEAGDGDTFESMLADVLSNLRRDTQVVVITTRSGLELDDGAARLTQGWVAAGGRPIAPALVIDAGKEELNEYFSGAEVTGAEEIEDSASDPGKPEESEARS